MSYLNKQGLDQLWANIIEKFTSQQDSLSSISQKVESLSSYGDTLPEEGEEGQFFFLIS